MWESVHSKLTESDDRDDEDSQQQQQMLLSQQPHTSSGSIKGKKISSWEILPKAL